jgi:hypothetical protein
MRPRSPFVLGAPIHDPAHRRAAGRVDFNQIKSRLSRTAKRICGHNRAHMFSGLIYQVDRRDPNLFVVSEVFDSLMKVRARDSISN